MTVSIGDLKRAFFIAKGFSDGSLEKQAMDYFNSLSGLGGQEVSYMDSLQALMVSLGYSSSNSPQTNYIASLTKVVGSVCSLVDLETLFYSSTGNVFS